MIDNFCLCIVMQKFGCLSDDLCELLVCCGIKINFYIQCLIVMVENMLIDILCVCDDDIFGLVMDGVVDFGIIGENVLEEELFNCCVQGEDLCYFILCCLDFGGCCFLLVMLVDEVWDGLFFLNGKCIVIFYFYLFKCYFDQKGIFFKFCLLNGFVEVVLCVGLVDVICDLVFTGVMLEVNGLCEVEVIYCLKVCLIQCDGKMEEFKQ